MGGNSGIVPKEGTGSWNWPPEGAGAPKPASRSQGGASASSAAARPREGSTWGLLVSSASDEEAWAEDGLAAAAPPPARAAQAPAPPTPRSSAPSPLARERRGTDAADRRAAMAAAAAVRVAAPKLRAPTAGAAVPAGAGDLTNNGIGSDDCAPSVIVALAGPEMSRAMNRIKALSFGASPCPRL